MIESAAPSGTVTFLFTDIEGSTRLWDLHPTAMSESLSIHDSLLTNQVESHDGYVFSRAGDGWGVAFASPTSALEAALRIQEEIARQPWPEPIPEIKIRMGLHAGTSTERGGDYFGTSVNRAARVAGVANGGQVFLTDAVHMLAKDEAKSGWRFRDLGEHRLRDLTRPERIWQLDDEQAPVPLATLTRRTTVGNLPRQRTSIIGRDAMIAEIALAATDNSLVTLVGVGGVGKTTVAKAVGSELSDDFPGGAWFVDLTTVTDPEEIATAVAAALNVAERPGMSTTESLVDALVTEDRLVILDNAEHQIDGVADLVDALLSGVPNVHLIVTSREPLSLTDEIVHRVGPLGVSHGSGSDAAVELFIARAKAAAPDLPEDEFDIDTVEAICQRLDGLPLAIELAASQSHMMTPHEILIALQADGLSLQSGSRSTTQRHRSLSDLVGWSYELLDPKDQVVFERLSVFRGGCTVDAAVAVCSDDEISERAVRNAVATLARKSMVTPDRSGAATRLTMLETLRTFSHDVGSTRDDREQTLQAHAEWFGQLSEVTRTGMTGPHEAAALAGMVADLDNVQSAMAWSGLNQKFDLMERLATGLPYVMGSKMRPGIREWLTEAIDALPQNHPARTWLALAVAYADLFGGDFEGTHVNFATATSSVEDRTVVEASHSYLQVTGRFFAGDLNYVIQKSEPAMIEAFAVGLVREGGALAADLSLALWFVGQEDEARRIAKDLNNYAAESDNTSANAWSMYLKGELLAEADPSGAVEALEESIELALSVDNEFVVGISLIAMSSIAGRNGDTDTALDGMHRCIRLWRAAGNRPQMWTAVRNLAEILHGLGMDVEALTLNAAVESDSDRAPELIGPYGDHYKKILTDAEAGLTDAEVGEASVSGGGMTYAQAAELALQSIETAQSERTKT
ncbi:MAG: NB-ARC domain-containing protein [Actinomycetota bacterium]|nr:NB-ARC domain-containing protein [Actinomycetota bacterium]